MTHTAKRNDGDAPLRASKTLRGRLLIGNGIGFVVLVLLAGYQFGGERWFYALLYLLPGIITIGVIVFLARRNYGSPAITWFLLFLSALATWSVMNFFSSLSTTATGYEFWTGLSVLGYNFVPPLFFTFALVFTGRELNLQRYVYWLVVFVPALIFSYFIWNTDLFIVIDFERAVLRPWGPDAPTAPYFWAYLAWFELFFVTAFATVIRQYRKTREPLKRKQLGLLIIAIAIPLVGGTVTDGILPVLGQQVFPSAVPLLTGLSLVVSYAIVRYGLFRISPAAIGANVLSSISQAIVAVDDTGSVRFVNPAAENLFGTGKQLLGRSAASLFGSTLVKDLWKTTQPGAHVEVKLQTINQGTIDASITNTPIMESGLIGLGQSKYRVGAVISITDVSERAASRKKMELAMEETKKKTKEAHDAQRALLNVVEDLEESKRTTERERQRDEAILASLGEGLVATDETGKIARVNNAAARLLGLSEADLQGKWFHKAVRTLNESEQVVEPLDHPVLRCLEEGRSVNEIVYLPGKENKVFPASLTAAPILEDQKPIGAVVVFRDITREREIDKAKSEFVSLASHQLRTPLSAINWYAEMLAAGDAGKLNDEQKQYVDEIYKGNQRMVELVNALLNVSRLDLGTFMIEPELTDPVKVAKDIVEEIEPQVFKRKLDLQEHYGTDVPQYQLDTKLFRMIIQNLLSNAVKYTPEGGKVDLHVRKADEKGYQDGLSITVVDTGLGIPKEQQSKIFSKLFRADNVRESDTEGTGLGLYIIKSIVDYSGGKIWFESEKDKGTTFHVLLTKQGMVAKEGSRALG